MDPRPAPQKQRNLTQEAFSAFLLWLDPSQGQAAREYLNLRTGMVRYFVRKGCTHAEELADRTLDRVAMIVHREPEKYPTPVSLCCSVARLIWHESLREKTPGTLDDIEIPAMVPFKDDFSDEELRCLTLCLDQLSIRDRELITQYHQFDGRQKIETRKYLAELHGGMNKLRITAYRIRIRLQGCVSSCTQRSALN
jgi:hypothetical protein